MVVAHCGDTRAVLLRSGFVFPLTEDHKPKIDAEKKRIEAAGGRVEDVNGVARINGKLAVARAFGDVVLKVRGHTVRESLSVVVVVQRRERGRERGE